MPSRQPMASRAIAWWADQMAVLAYVGLCTAVGVALIVLGPFSRPMRAPKHRPPLRLVSSDGRLVQMDGARR